MAIHLSDHAFITFNIRLNIAGCKWVRTNKAEWDLFRRTLAALLPSWEETINSVDDLNSLEYLTTQAMKPAPGNGSALNVEAARGGPLNCRCLGDRSRNYLGVY